MALFINAVSIFFMVSGLVFFLGGAIGIIRMPDFYSRLHPAGKLDTLGIMAMVLGFVVYQFHHLSLATALVSIKMLLIVFFVFMSSPTATHSIVDAGMRAGLRPWTKKNGVKRNGNTASGSATQNLQANKKE